MITALLCVLHYCLKHYVCVQSPVTANKYFVYGIQCLIKRYNNKIHMQQLYYNIKHSDKQRNYTQSRNFSFKTISLAKTTIHVQYYTSLTEGSSYIKTKHCWLACMHNRNTSSNSATHIEIRKYLGRRHVFFTRS